MFDQIFVALHFNIFTPEFERAFGKANFRLLVCLVLYR